MRVLSTGDVQNPAEFLLETGILDPQAWSLDELNAVRDLD